MFEQRGFQSNVREIYHRVVQLNSGSGGCCDDTSVEGGNYRVRVVMDKITGMLETFKERAGKLVRYASGPDFRSAMIQATICGPEPDEPVSVLELVVV